MTSNATFPGEYGAEKETHHLLKRTFVNVVQVGIGPFLRDKIAALVSARNNPNTNLIDLIYKGESPI